MGCNGQLIRPKPICEDLSDGESLIQGKVVSRIQPDEVENTVIYRKPKITSLKKYILMSFLIFNVLFFYIFMKGKLNSNTDDSNQIRLISKASPKIESALDTLEILPLEHFRSKGMEDYETYKTWSIFPDFNLMICAIPKAGSTSILKLARYVREEPCDDIYVCSQPWSTKWGKVKTKAGLIDNNVIKGVMFRDPKERLLSAYNDKCIRNCCDECPNFNQEPTFEKFVDRLIKKGPGWNAHFLKMEILCGTMRRFLGLFNWIAVLGDLPGETYAQIQQLVDKDDRFQSPLFQKGVELMFNENKLFVNGTFKNFHNEASHTRSANLMKTFYTEELIQKVENYYERDYIMLADLVRHPAATPEFRKRFAYLLTKYSDQFPNI